MLNRPISSRGDAPTDFCELHEVREVCTASSLLDAAGNEAKGLYRIATEFCPREGNAAGVTQTVKEIALLNLDRKRINGAKVARDENYLWENVAALGSCTVHTEAVKPPVVYDPSTFDPDDPSTYPPTDQDEYKDFDPMNPETWPTIPSTPGTGESQPPETSPVIPSPTPSHDGNSAVAPPAVWRG